MARCSGELKLAPAYMDWGMPMGYRYILRLLKHTKDITKWGQYHEEPALSVLYQAKSMAFISKRALRRQCVAKWRNILNVPKPMPKKR